MRLLHLTDLHLTDGPRLDEQGELLAGIVTKALSAGVHATLLTGDLYGRTVPHRSTPRERAVLYPQVRRLTDAGPVVVVRGNHDYPGDLDTLEQIGGGLAWPVVVVQRPRVLTLATRGGPLRVYPLPWPTTRLMLTGKARRWNISRQRQAASEALDTLLGLWARRVQRARQQNPNLVQVFAAHCMVSGSRASGGEVLSGREIEISAKALEGLGVDYGALGHMHPHHEIAERCFYGGDPWPVDFGEREPKGWTLIEVGDAPHEPMPMPSSMTHLDGRDGRPRVSVYRIPTPHRPWITLRWRWAADHAEGAPRWVEKPTAEQLAAVAGAEVRAQLVVPQQWRAGCPWDQVLADLEERGAHRITAEPVVEPVHRVRAPKVAKATSPVEKMRAYWDTLETVPAKTDREAAEELLAELLTDDDDAIRETTGHLLAQDHER